VIKLLTEDLLQVDDGLVISLRHVRRIEDLGQNRTRFEMENGPDDVEVERGTFLIVEDAPFDKVIAAITRSVPPSFLEELVVARAFLSPGHPAEEGMSKAIRMLENVLNER
jgi:hypothetical protein